MLSFIATIFENLSILSVTKCSLLLPSFYKDTFTGIRILVLQGFVLNTSNLSSIVFQFPVLLLKAIPYSWTRKCDVAKTAILLRLMYRFNPIPFKIPAGFFFRNWQADPKIHMQTQGTKNSQDNLEKEEQKWRNSSWFQNLLQTTVIKTGWL